MKISKRLLVTVAALCVVSTGTAQAATFVLTDTGGTAVGTQARNGFEIAAAYWSSVLKDNVTINLNIGFSALGTGILGSTGSARSLLSMNQTYNALNADRTSALDNQAVANLRPLGTSTSIPGAGAVTFTGNAINATNNGYVDTATRIDNDGGVNNSTTAVTKASAKALGLTTDVNGTAINYATADGSITFSSAFAFDFDPTNGIDARFVRFHRCRNPRDRPRTRLRQRRGQLRCPYRPRGHGGNAGNVRRRQPARSVPVRLGR